MNEEEFNIKYMHLDFLQNTMVNIIEHGEKVVWKHVIENITHAQTRAYARSVYFEALKKLNRET